MYHESVQTDDLANLNYLFNNGPFKVDPLYMVIPAMSKKKVEVTLVAEDAGTYEEFLEVLPSMAEPQLIRMIASVQDVHVALNRYFIEYQQLYASKVYSIEREPQVIKLRNLGNIASKFKWTLPVNSDIIQTIIDPMEGTVEPKSELIIRVKFAIKLFGKFTFYYRCDFDNIDLPLGFELTGSVFGLNIAYENMPIVDELAISRKKNLKKMQKNLNSTNKTTDSNKQSIHSSSVPETTASGEPLEDINLNTLSINEPSTFSFKIKNLSGIPTYYRLYFSKFDASHLAKQMTANKLQISGGPDSNPSNIMDQSFSKNKSFSNRNFSIHSDSVTRTRNMGMTSTANRRMKLLNDEVEQTHVFYSENGMKATQAKYAQREAEEFLTTGKGIALVCEPTEGNLSAHSEITVKVKIYNEISGVYDDTLCCDIKGLETKQFPVKLFIQGSPLKIPTDQVGLKIQSDPPTLDFGGKLKDSNHLEKFLKLMNIGTQPLTVLLKIYNVDDLDKNRDQFRISIQQKRPGTNELVHVKWNPIEPEKTSNAPFSLEQYEVVVPAKTTIPVKIKYDSNDIRAFNSVLTATPKFSKTSASAEVDLGQLSVLLKSCTINPRLYLHEQVVFLKLAKLERRYLFQVPQMVSRTVSKADKKHLAPQQVTLSPLLQVYHRGTLQFSGQHQWQRRLLSRENR